MSIWQWDGVRICSHEEICSLSGIPQDAKEETGWKDYMEYVDGWKVIEL